MKKILFAVPPIQSPKGYATVSQNRQFQFFRTPFFAYPIVPALCATMLEKYGHQVSWIDCPAEDMSDIDFAKLIANVRPEYIILESPTPTIYKYWEVINGIKLHLPDIKIILCGSHATALPSESKEKCKADFIVEGGDWHYKAFEIIQGCPWDMKAPMPHINRVLTKWWLYAYKNGNFKYLPGTYIMSAIDCWYGKCEFCSWASYNKNYYRRSPSDVLDEIERLTEAGFKEIFDDSGTFPIGGWLKEFCNGMIERDLPRYISLGCNMRFGSLQKEDFDLMSKAGFRFILWGCESIHQKTLDLINKSFETGMMREDLTLAKKAGIESHLTVMFGYPWESLREARETRRAVKKMLLSGLAESAQATICIPYPGTPLWKKCKEAGLLLTEDWSRYDMTEPIMKIPYSKKELFALQRSIYNVAYNPLFILRKLAKIKSLNDIKYYTRTARKIFDRFGNIQTYDRPAK